MLYRSPHRKERVRDHLQASERRLDAGAVAGDGHPCELRLGERGELREAPEGEDERGPRSLESGARAGRVRAEGVAREDLVADDGQTPALASASSSRALQVRARRVVGAHGHDAARARRDRRAHGRKIDVPGAVVGEAIGDRRDRLEPREVIEQRIARARHEHLVAGIAQELEEKPVRLARARGQHDASRIDRRSMRGQLARHGLARRRETERRRLVDERSGEREGRQDRVAIVGDRGARRVRRGQIERRPIAPRRASAAASGFGDEIERRAGGEHRPSGAGRRPRRHRSEQRLQRRVHLDEFDGHPVRPDRARVLVTGLDADDASRRSCARVRPATRGTRR